MALNEEELRTLMVAEAEAIIGKMLAERKPGEEITLSDIEQSVLSAGRRFQAMLTQKLVEEQPKQSSEERPRCRVCGTAMRHHGYRKKRVVTEAGEVSIRRAYYRCETCQEGFFPPG